jgi:hypothetical protein
VACYRVNFTFTFITVENISLTQSTISGHIMNNILILGKIDQEYLESFEICYWIKDEEDQFGPIM